MKVIRTYARLLNGSGWDLDLIDGENLLNKIISNDCYKSISSLTNESKICLYNYSGKEIINEVVSDDWPGLCAIDIEFEVDGDKWEISFMYNDKNEAYIFKH